MADKKSEMVGGREPKRFQSAVGDRKGGGGRWMAEAETVPVSDGLHARRHNSNSVSISSATLADCAGDVAGHVIAIDTSPLGVIDQT